MDRNKHKVRRRRRRHGIIRRRVIGTPHRPRLAVYKSVHHFYAQVIDDLAGHTLVSACTLERDLGLTKTWNVAAAQAVGTRLAQRALDRGIRQVVFDRGGFAYHGRVAAFADAARKGGLEF